MNNAVSYSDSGMVNYVKLLTSFEFKNLKANFALKKSFESDKIFSEFQENDESERIIC
jgi:hypothetical protein